MKTKFLKSAFTLAEVLVCLAVLSVLATILIPTLGQFKPNKTKTMFKKTYQVAERIIYEMVNDNELYPDVDGIYGFDNVAKIKYDGVEYGSDTTNSDAAKCKFTKLFALKLNTLSTDPSCGNYTWTNGSVASGSFVTTDGVVWALPKSNFTAGSSDGVAWKKIMIDVNGSKAPNTMDLEGDSDKCTNDVDRFTLYVRSDGLISVKGACAREYMNELSLVNTKKSGKTNSQMGGSSNISVVDDGTGHFGGTSGAEPEFDGDVGTYDPGVDSDVGTYDPGFPTPS